VMMSTAVFGAVKRWRRKKKGVLHGEPPLSEGAQCGLGASVWTGSPTDESQAVFNFSNLFKTGSNLKFKMGMLSC
jgi:hypothetical protein